MAKLLFLAFALSLDTFLVSIALGTTGLGRTAKRNLVLLFAFCEGAVLRPTPTTEGGRFGIGDMPFTAR